MSAHRARHRVPAGSPPAGTQRSARELIDTLGCADREGGRASRRRGADETATVVVRCDFKPERVLVDPDVRVLQLNRKQAVAKL